MPGMRVRLRHAAFALHMGLLLSVFAISPANAYIDPGSGSIIFQAVVGAAMAISLTAKLFWRRIAAFFQRKRP